MPTDIKGLTTREAQRKLEEVGKNMLPEKRPPSDLSIFLSQLKSPLVYILLAAAFVTLLLGHRTDTVVILFAVFINTVLGYFQERRAQNALEALKKLIHPTAKVVRDGKRKTINATEVVPGDICIINSGDKIPADGKIISANRFFVSEAILTGESVPVSKNKDDKVFMGTIVTSGEAKVLIEKTGADTEIGKIALSVQTPVEDTPLRKQLARFSKQLTILVLALNIFVFVVGLLAGKNLVEIFTTSVALAVSAIPEGLLVGLTVVLAIGMQRILKRKGLVRNLVSAETLGGVTAICVDKTGTLTQGRMKVTDVVGNSFDAAKQALIANDLDDPLVISLFEWAEKKLSAKDIKGENLDNYISKHPRIDSIPFSSKERFFASLNQVSPKQKVLFVSGAPEYLLEWTDLKEQDKKEILREIDKLTEGGKRVVGMAKKAMPFGKEKISANDVKKDLEWVALIGFSDPLRDGVKEALDLTKKAKVKLYVITGDYSQTAISIVRQLGIPASEKDIILGSELSDLNSSKLSQLLAGNSFKIFARTTPQQKLKIVEALKNNGEVVAMTGDGVNDAPALKKADIGIVVGDASDVAKESADMVLLDSSFATIVAAIEEGRGLFDNIRKIILYLMSDAFSEIVAVIGSIILSVTIIPGIPLPITAVQILWINLISDGFPHLALTIDPKRENIMSDGPRSPQEQLITGWMKRLIFIVSATAGIMALLVFVFYYSRTSNLKLSQSLAFAVLGMNSLFYVYSIRTLQKPLWRVKPFENRWLNLAVFGGILLQILPFVIPAGRKFLNLYPLAIQEWSIVFTTSFIMIIIVEVVKHNINQVNSKT